MDYSYLPENITYPVFLYSAYSQLKPPQYVEQKKQNPLYLVLQP